MRLMLALREAGYDVVALAPSDNYSDRIVDAGIEHRAIDLRGSSVNPILELRGILDIFRVVRSERIDFILSYTPKGNIYSGVVCSIAGIKIFPNVSGLGRVFIKKSFLTVVVKILYKIAFRRAKRVFFQNRDDLDLFVELGLVEKSKAERVPGSGVDIRRFAEATNAYRETDSREGFVFLLVARLLWDKGVGEFVEAARKVKSKFPTVQFHILGFLDVQNPSAVSRDDVATWEREGIIRYLGSTDEVLPHLQSAQCVVLPSYREGCPRVLLEAAACAQPVITTDVPGCRDVVDDDVTGYLCRVKDSGDLADKMLRMLRLNDVARREMGRNGRKKMLLEFDEDIVINRYLKALEEC